MRELLFRNAPMWDMPIELKTRIPDLDIICDPSHIAGNRDLIALICQKALDLDPKDPYNLVFAAVFMAASGRGDEALKIARENRNLLPASYNLAAIYAQTGHRREALSLLHRHFFRYERYQAVRAKEMMEARVDAVFDSLRQDSAFLALTSGADGKLQMPMKPVTGTMNHR